MPQAQASWIKDEGRWCIAVPEHLAKVGERVVISRSDGSHVRTVVIKRVTERSWKGRLICIPE